MPCRTRLLAFCASVLLAGCSISNLNLVTDHRLHFLQPANRAHLHVPVDLSWTFTGLGDYFAIFVDRSPVHPGESLDAIASDDPSCKHPPGCDNPRYFASHQIYTTAADSFVLQSVDNLSATRQKEQLHQVTIILLDRGGRRIGESAWYRYFWLPEGGVS